MQTPVDVQIIAIEAENQILFSVTVGFAQSFSGDKLFISVDGGKGVLFGKSNLSPFGVNYRGEYNGDLTI